MKVWVDTQTGTWGDPNFVRILEIPDVDDFAELSDQDRSELALDYGKEINA